MLDGDHLCASGGPGPIDAEMITRYAEAKCPAALVPPRDEQLALQALCRRRPSLIGQLVKERNALGKADHPIVRRNIQSSIEGLESRVTKMDREIDNTVTKSVEPSEKRACMESIKGLAECPRT